MRRRVAAVRCYASAVTLAHVVAHPGGREPLPAVVALHGHGANAQDLIGLAPHLAGGRALWLCPQAQFTIDPRYYAFTWFQRGPDGRSEPERFERTVEAVRDFIEEAVERYPVDPARIVLLGFSQGGRLAYRIALAEPRRFAGLAALSASLSDELIETLEPGDGVGELSVLVQHGSDDPTVDVDRARQSRERLQAMGVEPEYREYPMGHEIGQQSGRDLSAWLERVLDLGPAAGLA